MAKAAVHTSPMTSVSKVASTSLAERTPKPRINATSTSDSTPAAAAPSLTLFSSSVLSAILPVKRMVTSPSYWPATSAARVRARSSACLAGCRRDGSSLGWTTMNRCRSRRLGSSSSNRACHDSGSARPAAWASNTGDSSSNTSARSSVSAPLSTASSIAKSMISLRPARDGVSASVLNTGWASARRSDRSDSSSTSRYSNPLVSKNGPNPGA